MELVSKIFETLEISQLALLQLGLVVVLAFLLSTLLIRPILRTFEERENLSVKPIEESRRLLSEADEKARGYDEALRKGAAEALARKRRVMEETSRAGRRQVEAVIEETNLKVEELKGRIAVREGIGRRVPARPGVAALHGDRPESPRETGRVSSPRTHARRALRFAPPLPYLVFRRRRVRRGGGRGAPGRRSPRPLGGDHQAGDQLPHPRRRARLLPAQAALLLSQGAKRTAAQGDRRCREGSRGGGGEAGRHRGPHRETGRRDRRDEREDGRRGRRRGAAPAGDRRRRDLPDPRPVGVHRRTGSEEGPRGAAPGGVPPYGPRRRGARPQDLSPEDQERLVRENLEKIEGIVH